MNHRAGSWIPAGRDDPVPGASHATMAGLYEKLRRRAPAYGGASMISVLVSPCYEPELFFGASLPPPTVAAPSRADGSVPDRVASIWRTLDSWALMLSRRWV